MALTDLTVKMEMLGNPNLLAEKAEELCLLKERIAVEMAAAAEEKAKEQAWYREVRAKEYVTRESQKAARAARFAAETEVCNRARLAVKAVEAGEVKPRFQYNLHNTELLCEKIMLNVGDRLGNYSVNLPGNGVLTEYMFDVLALAPSEMYGDQALFHLNPLTGEIGVELKGNGGLGGNAWYVVSKHRPGSITQECSRYRGAYIAEILEGVAVSEIIE